MFAFLYKNFADWLHCIMHTWETNRYILPLSKSFLQGEAYFCNSVVLVVMTATAAELIRETKLSPCEGLAFHCPEELNTLHGVRHVTVVSANQADDKYKKKVNPLL